MCARGEKRDEKRRRKEVGRGRARQREYERDVREREPLCVCEREGLTAPPAECLWWRWLGRRRERRRE